MFYISPSVHLSARFTWTLSTLCKLPVFQRLSWQTVKKPHSANILVLLSKPGLQPCNARKLFPIYSTENIEQMGRKTQKQQLQNQAAQVRISDGWGRRKRKSEVWIDLTLKKSSETSASTTASHICTFASANVTAQRRQPDCHSSPMSSWSDCEKRRYKKRDGRSKNCWFTRV